MNVHTVLAVAALVGALVLLATSSARLGAIVAAIAAGIDVLIRMGFIHIGVSGVSLGLVIGLLLAIPGAICWIRVSAKTGVSAATVVALVGVLKVVIALGIRI
jgi:hypothetical protein